MDPTSDRSTKIYTIRTNVVSTNNKTTNCYKVEVFVWQNKRPTATHYPFISPASSERVLNSLSKTPQNTWGYQKCKRADRE